MPKKTTTAKKAKKESADDVAKREFEAKVVELKKEKTKEELLEIVSIQPLTHELRDFLAARKALDEMGVKYSKSFEEE